MAIQIATITPRADASVDIQDERIEKQLRGLAGSPCNDVDQDICPRFTLEAQVREVS